MHRSPDFFFVLAGQHPKHAFASFGSVKLYPGTRPGQPGHLPGCPNIPQRVVLVSPTVEFYTFLVLPMVFYSCSWPSSNKNTSCLRFTGGIWLLDVIHFDQNWCFYLSKSWKNLHQSPHFFCILLGQHLHHALVSFGSLRHYPGTRAGHGLSPMRCIEVGQLPWGCQAPVEPISALRK